MKTRPSFFYKLKEINIKTIAAPQILRNALGSLKDQDIEHVFIYGSFAKKEEREDRDIALLIEGKVHEDKTNIPTIVY